MGLVIEYRREGLHSGTGRGLSCVLPVFVGGGGGVAIQVTPTKGGGGGGY